MWFFEDVVVATPLSRKGDVVPAGAPTPKPIYEQKLRWRIERYITCELVKSSLYRVKETFM
jgi:hypothetical protein